MDLTFRVVDGVTYVVARAASGAEYLLPLLSGGSPPPAGSAQSRPQTLRPYLFKEFKRQPVLGWAESGDLPITTLGDATAMLVAAYHSPWWSRQAAIGLDNRQPGDDSSVPPPPPPSDSGAYPSVPLRPYLYREFRRQPVAGWAEAGDAAEGTPTSTPLRPYLFKGFRPQPVLGWAEAGDSAESFAPPLLQRLRPYLFKEFGRQPVLGWAESGDSADAVPIAALPPMRPYLFRGFPRQAALGFTPAQGGAAVVTTGFRRELRPEWYRTYSG